MSRIGNKPIKITEGCQVKVTGNEINIIGPKGQVSALLPKNLELIINKDEVLLKRKKDNKITKSLHGLYRSILSNAINGVIKPWEKRLEVSGTGFNVKLAGEDLQFKVGYSHPVIFKKVQGITFMVNGNNKIVVQGVDKQLVGQIADKIKAIKKPDVYKGKGIKYENEWLRIKPGKKAKTEEVA
jgi:large subunit ribosomal protein L6